MSVHPASPDKGLWFSVCQGHQLLLPCPSPKSPMQHLRAGTGAPGPAEADAEGATSPHKHPSGTVPSSILPPAAAAGMPRGRFLSDAPGWLLPLPLNSFHLPGDARGKFGLGWGTPLCPASGGRQDGGPALPPAGEEGRKRGNGSFSTSMKAANLF